MKKLILTTLTIFIWFFVVGQTTAIETRTFSFGDPQHNMIEKLTPIAKNTLFSFLQENNIDTTKIYRVKYEEVFTKYTTRNYLSKQKYTFIRWSKYGTNIIIKQKEVMDENYLPEDKKIIILYTTNFNEIEDLLIYIFG